ncbi:MAG: Hypothetical protein BHV28_12730 [Candidatus Tokpelaia hoelldobleri]|uniref:Lectin-like protein BA14k n=1 Tax=Candidatus Tokpelaia hoelldobleri TaxID=1902579 RepID=A0A1U9JVP9_9HYPH|nr:MAG: Hypothetical protein BHV28_12730 [Candidatus Tokpelaia hoelldoblerii]
MRRAFYILAGGVFLLFSPAAAMALEIDNPYIRQSPAPLPLPAPGYRQAPTPQRRPYNPKPVSPAAPPSVNTTPNANHIEWCQSRYRSYRLRDNSYVPPSGGGRVPCASPYRQ